MSVGSTGSVHLFGTSFLLLVEMPLLLVAFLFLLVRHLLLVAMHLLLVASKELLVNQPNGFLDDVRELGWRRARSRTHGANETNDTAEASTQTKGSGPAPNGGNAQGIPLIRKWGNEAPAFQG